MERTLVLVKPDGVQRGLIGEAISRFERRGLRLVAAKFIQVSNALAESHYAEHKGKPFYDGKNQPTRLAAGWDTFAGRVPGRRGIAATPPAAAHSRLRQRCGLRTPG